MSDRLLLIHWNELSIPAHVTADQLETDPRWKQLALSALQALLEVLKARPDCRISFTRGILHGHVGDRPLQSWLETWLGKDKWRKLRGRAVQPTATVFAPAHTLECELSCNGRCGEGITRAHIAETWAWSIGSEDTGSAGDSIRAVKTTIHADEATDVEVSNLASQQHFNLWLDDLLGWGQAVSSNHVISDFEGYKVIMYPFDHGYPHIHVHAHDDERLNAKYRVDVFEPLTKQRPAGLDAMMETWIEERRGQLIESWRRCQAGLFPIKIHV